VHTLPEKYPDITDRVINMASGQKIQQFQRVEADIPHLHITTAFTARYIFIYYLLIFCFLRHEKQKPGLPPPLITGQYGTTGVKEA
jgi:hypothetical protein